MHGITEGNDFEEPLSHSLDGKILSKKRELCLLIDQTNYQESSLIQKQDLVYYDAICFMC